jgi:lysylphosphatidylglycerol synthetase-like protein (DUF2156 family)
MRVDVTMHAVDELGDEPTPSAIARVPTGGRVFVVGDLHLGPLADETTNAATAELSRLLDAVEGPALLVLAGDTFELAGRPNNTPSKVLAAHPQIAAAIARFAAGDARGVVVLAGDRDGAIVEEVWARREVERLLCASVASTLLLEISTGRRVERVQIEHGDRLSCSGAPRGANGPARHHAVGLGQCSVDGLVTGHTLAAELIDLGGCWYANCGCANQIVEHRPRRFGHEPVPVTVRQVSWVELEAGTTLHVHLAVGRSASTHLGPFDRLTTRPPDLAVPVKPAVVATLTPGQIWPPERLPDPTRRPRRVAAAGLGVIGAVNLLSALTPPLRERLEVLHGALPFAVPEIAAAAVAALGIGLCVLAAAVRRGQRRAWIGALALLAASVVGHLTKGLDVEEAALAAGLFAYLAVHGAAFGGRSGARQGRSRLALLASVVVGAGAVAVLTTVLAFRVPGRIALPAVGGRLIGLPTVALPERADLLSPVLAVIGLSSVALALWTVLRPARAQPTADDKLAWELVQRHASDTLDYFALRDDKQRFVWENTVVAYAVRNGTAIVSPDPVGPADERSGAWSAFRQHATANGWNVAVLGAGAASIPIYRAAGMTAVYVGDEGIVDTRRFSLDGGRCKALRQAVHRVDRAGYTVSFHDPANLPAELAERLRQVMAQSRRGAVERGFSMTLSRVFDARDTGLLLAIANAPDGSPAAFCQFVPAPGIGGFSLDLMRRSDGPHPNGLMDFVIVRTIEHLAALDLDGLGLNFATMRAVVAGEALDGVATRLQRQILRRLSDDMQIESLWRFSAKFDPTWRPRFVVLDAPELVFGASLAIARAESFWELPVVGRFLRPAPTPV